MPALNPYLYNRLRRQFGAVVVTDAEQAFVGMSIIRVQVPWGDAAASDSDALWDAI